MHTAPRLEIHYWRPNPYVRGGWSSVTRAQVTASQSRGQEAASSLSAASYLLPWSERVSSPRLSLAFPVPPRVGRHVVFDRWQKSYGITLDLLLNVAT